MLRHNDLKAWRIFLDVIQVGSISAASELCQMEPSNISRTLTALEKSLGQKLFLRQNPIKLTTYGTRAVRLAQNIIDAHDQLVILGGNRIKLYKDRFVAVYLHHFLIDCFCVTTWISTKNTRASKFRHRISENRPP